MHMRRSVLLLTLLLLMSSIASTLPYPTASTTSVLATASSSPSSGIDLIITDENSAPLQNATVEMFDGVTGVRILGPADMPARSRELFSGLPPGPVRLHVTHSTHADGWGLEKLVPDQDVGLTIVLTSLTGALNLQTGADAQLELTLDGHQQELTAISNETGAAGLAVPSGGSGWLLAEGSAGASLVHWNGSANLSAPLNGTMRIFGWSDDINGSGTVLAEHSTSGWREVISWTSEIDLFLPRTDEGEWNLWAVIDGQRSAPVLTLGDNGTHDISTWLNGTGSAPEQVSGDASIILLDDLLRGEPVNATWSANISLPLDIGTALLPDRVDGLRTQVDRWMGDGDGSVSASEAASLAMLLSNNGWWHSGHWLLYDETPFNPDSEMNPQGLAMDGLVGPVTAIGGTFGWSESGNLTGWSGQSSVRLLWFPVRADPLEGIPLHVDLSSNWEVRYSPQQQLLEGETWSFSITRSNSPVTGTISVALGENQPPVAEGSLYAYSGDSVPFDRNVTFDGTGCSDSGFGELNHLWELRHNGTLVHSAVGNTLTVVPRHLGVEMGATLNATLTCTDGQGLSGVWEGEWYVDGTPPTALVNGTEDRVNPGDVAFFDMHLLDSFNLNAGSYFSALAFPEDDSGEFVTVTWHSNKSEGWTHSDHFFNDQFNQGTDVNWAHDPIDERHKQRNLTVWNLSMELEDSAGNTFVRYWDITMNDTVAPTITAELLVDGLPYGAENPARPDSQLSLDLNETFDDIDAVEDLIFSIEIDDIVVVEFADWETARYVDLPSLDVGEHQLRVQCADTAGGTDSRNLRELITNPVVHPLEVANLSIASVEMEGIPVPGESGVLQVNVVNTGANSAKFTICYGDVCAEDILSTVATADGHGNATYPLEVSEFESGRIKVNLTWTDTSSDANGSQVFQSDLTATPGWVDNVRLLIWILVVGGLFWFIVRAWLSGGSKGQGKAPF